MDGPVAPMLLLTGVSFANHWYNTGSADWKILLEGGVATALLSMIAAVPGWRPVTGALAWLAFTAGMIAPVQVPTPAQNLLKITGA